MIVVSDHRNLLSQVWSLILRSFLCIGAVYVLVCHTPRVNCPVIAAGPMTIVGAIWVWLYKYIETVKFCDPVTLVTLLLFESVTFLW